MTLFSALISSIAFTGLAYAGDEQTINAALEAQQTVQLEAKTYELTGPIYIHSNNVLVGQEGTVLQVSSSSSQWFKDGTGIITTTDSELNNVEICHLSINGNCQNLPSSYANSGNGIHNAERLIDFRGPSNNHFSNIAIHDCKLYDAFSDAVHLAFCDNVQCYNLLCSNCQHSTLFLIDCIGGAVHDNSIAGITSDSLRFDDCQQIKVYNNVLFSYTGDHNNGAYEKGENSIQIGDESNTPGPKGGSSKPDKTQNIEVWNNTFAGTGLRAILLDNVELGSEANVFIHNNIFLTQKELETAGISFNYSDFNSSTITLERSEQVFSSIFDILKLKFSDSGYTNQTSDSIQYTVQQTEQGVIAGGIKIVGFSNVVSIDGRNYIPDNNSILVKYAAVKAPSLNFISGGVSSIKPTVETSIVNGTAFATLTVKMEYYTVSVNRLTNKKVKQSHKATATFYDSCKAPELLPKQQDITAYVDVYPTVNFPQFTVNVGHDNFTQKIVYSYNDVNITHTLMKGEYKTDSKGINHIIYFRVDRWDSSNLSNIGDMVTFNSPFNPNGLSVYYSTPYETIKVTDIKVTVHEVNTDSLLGGIVGFLLRFFMLISSILMIGRIVVRG